MSLVEESVSTHSPVLQLDRLYWPRTTYLQDSKFAVEWGVIELKEIMFRPSFNPI